MTQALLESPIGSLRVETTSRGLHRLSFASTGPTVSMTEAATSDDPILAETARQLQQYFEGQRQTFDLPLDIEGTPFRQRVWQAISAIPYGATASYAEVAAMAGAPGAYRAAGSACGANHVAIVIPCHRVVGSDRSLHGFGAGLDTKAALLRLEGSLDESHNRVQPALVLA